MLSWRSGASPSSFTGGDTTAVEHSVSPRRFAWALVAFSALIGVGTVVYHAITNEGWVASLYRTVVTTTLTGIDSKPPGHGAQLFTILLLWR